MNNNYQAGKRHGEPERARINQIPRASVPDPREDFEGHADRQINPPHIQPHQLRGPDHAQNTPANVPPVDPASMPFLKGGRGLDNRSSLPSNSGTLDNRPSSLPTHMRHTAVIEPDGKVTHTTVIPPSSSDESDSSSGDPATDLEKAWNKLIKGR